jgi:hypothetical protein
MKQKRDGIITFKVDEQLHDMLENLPNRSAFIRAAILTALDSTCPLCSGTGVLTPDQQRHWRQFAESHSVRTCTQCDAQYLVCGADPV